MTRRISGSTALLFLALLLAYPAASAQAQAPTIGYTNQEALLASMPEMEEVQQQLQEAYTTQQEEFQSEQQAFQESLQEYQQQQAMLSEEALAEREQELRQMQAELAQSARERDQALLQRERELMQPLIEELQAAVQEVAQEQGLDLVVQTQAIAWANEEAIVDITEEVASRLGIEVEAPAGAASN